MKCNIIRQRVTKIDTIHNSTIDRQNQVYLNMSYFVTFCLRTQNFIVIHPRRGLFKVPPHTHTHTHTHTHNTHQSHQNSTCPDMQSNVENCPELLRNVEKSSFENILTPKIDMIILNQTLSTNYLVIIGYFVMNLGQLQHFLTKYDLLRNVEFQPRNIEKCRVLYNSLFWIYLKNRSLEVPPERTTTKFDVCNKI